MELPSGNQGQWYDKLLTSEFGIAFLAFCLGVLKIAEKLLPFLIKRQRELDVVNGITDQSPAYLQMEKGLTEDKAQRVLMLAGHNCGSKPNILKPFYVSAIHAAADTFERKQRASAYKDRSVDSHYVNMLESMYRNGWFHFKMAEQAGTMLHEIYTAEGVTDSILCHLGVWNNSLIFASFAKFGGLFTPSQIIQFRLRADLIRHELKQAEKRGNKG